MGQFIKLLIGLPIAIAVVLFVLANRHVIEVETLLLSQTLSIPAYLLAIIPLFTGVLIGAAIITIRQVGLRIELRRLKHEVAILKEAEEKLKNNLEHYERIINQQERKNSPERSLALVEGKKSHG